MYCPFSQKVLACESPTGSATGPLWREIPIYRAFLHLTLNVSVFIFPSECLVREPPPCSLTGSPWTGILHHQSHWSIFSFIHSLIHVCLPEFSKRSPPTYGEEHKVTFHGAPRRWKAYTQWGVAWFPNRIVKDTISTPVPCITLHNIFHLGLGKPELH
jgi:hypothetical protein